MKALIPRLPALAAILLGALLAPPASAREKADTATKQIDALRGEYEKLLEHSDFASFKRRMATVRELGTLDHPRARKTLLDIVRRAKSLDDKAIAVLALGRELDVATAKTLAKLVAIRPADLLVENLGDAFGRASDEAVLTWLATEALQHKSPAVLQAALDAQYAHADPRIRERAMELYRIHNEKRTGKAIAHAAVRALGSVNGPEVRSFLIAAVAHEDWRVRLAVADVMAWQKPFDVNVRGTLRKLLVDDEPVVRQRAAATIGDTKMEELLPEVAERLDDVHIKTRAVAHAALRRMTHRDLGYDKADWLYWYKRRTETRGGLKASPSSSVVTYYGVNVHSDRLIFVVDVSGSMAMPRGGNTTRIQVAEAELRRVLGKLDPMTLFNVIVFSDKVKAWRKGETLATKANVAKATQWIGKTLKEPRGGTYMHAALKKAFAENPRMDTVFLLTDGLASDGEPIVPEAILASVSAWNRYRRVVINTFALTLEDENTSAHTELNLDGIKRFMQQLAGATGGKCTVITKAP